MIRPAAATSAGAAGKDSRWLTLEVCREFARSNCPRSADECKYAHPPPHVEIQNGRVTCCYDSIKVCEEVHCSLFTICGDAFPFHASVLRPASQVGPMHEAAGMGEFS